MKVKLISLLTGFVIFVLISVIIEFTIGWGMKNPWPFIFIWSGSMALAEVFILQPFRVRLKQKGGQTKSPKK
ncbi:MAG: hypothetical protein ACLGH8_12880 [Bacteroidia bacterium]|jgi:hypothetical protein